MANGDNDNLMENLENLRRENEEIGKRIERVEREVFHERITGDTKPDDTNTTFQIFGGGGTGGGGGTDIPD